MRLSMLLPRLAIFVAAAVGSVVAAQSMVETVELRSVEAVQDKLRDEGHEWATTHGDGLQVILEGSAPTEAMRFRAMSAASGVVDASRVIDNMLVVDAIEIAPPDFAIEILRNDSGVSLIGLIPTDTDRGKLARRIANIADDQPVTDLLEVADYDVPPAWPDALDYALRALEMLPRSKISVYADSVVVNAISGSPEEKLDLETALSRNAPNNVQLSVDITAPRPVISPYTTRFTLDAEGPRFDACAVNDEAAENAVLVAAATAGFSDTANCIYALGSPSKRWGEAVGLAISAIGALEGGTVTVSDTDITLVALMGTDQSTFDNVVGELENALPDVFALSAELPQPPEPQPDGPPQFTVTRSPEGIVQVRGRVPDQLTNTAVENYAFAKFGQANITMGTRIFEDLPQGWSVRVLTGMEALSRLTNGAVTVEPDVIRVRGNSGNEDASADITRLLIERLGQSADFEIKVNYVRQLDPIERLPTPEECIEQIEIITKERKITFDPSSATITADAQLVIDDISDVLKQCGDLRIQVAGFTDSQGREIMNQQLSQERANAVLTALLARRVPVSTFTAIGFGEADPIAPNDTEDGREANRRIEFSLIVPEPSPDDTTTLEEIAADPATAPTDQ